MQGLQLRQQRSEIAVLGVRHGRDPGPRQRVVVGAFAVFAGVDAHREGDIGHHAPVLGAAAARQEELGDGQLHLAEALAVVHRPAVQIDEVLHGAFAEAGFADDQPAAVVLDRTGENFRRRRRAAVDQHRERTVPRHAADGVAVDLHPAARFADLHHRALVDEQAGQFDGLAQRAAAVVAQIDYHAVEVLLAETAQQLFRIAGRRGVVVAVAALALEILIERRQLDHTDPARGRAVHARDGQHFALGGLLLQTDLGAIEDDPVRLAVQHRFGRHDVQTHLRALGALDLVDHIVDTPAHHVFHRPVRALADTDDAVAGLELAAEHRRTAGNQFADHNHVILLLELRTDAFQRQRHALLEAVGRARIEVIGVRIDRGGVGVEKGLERIDAVELGHALGHVGVALVERLADFVGLLAGEFQPQPVVAHGLFPEFVEFAGIGDPRRVFAVVLPAVAAIETENILGQQAARMRDALVHPSLIQREHLEGRRHFAALDGVVQLDPVSGELVDVRRGEEQFGRVERFEIALEHLGRQRVVQRPRAIGITTVGQDAVHQFGGGGLLGTGAAGIGLRSQPRHRHGQRESKQ